MSRRRLTAAAIACAWTAQAGAQTAPAPDSGGLQDVVVTAQRREQNIQDVPLAVSSFSADSLETLQATDALNVARLVPNFIAQNNVGQGSANSYYIRALGQTESFPTFEPQVSTYVDDIYIGRQNGNNFSLFDVDQVQVLRGPQGTLFGRNSTGGAVVISLKRPGETFGGYAEVGYGSYNRVFGRASVDVPLSPAVLTKTSFYGKTDDGYVTNLTTGQKINDVHDWGVREALLILPPGLDSVSWDISADYSDSMDPNIYNFLGRDKQRDSYSGYNNNGGALLPYLSGRKATYGQGVDVRSYGAMSNIAWRTDAGTLNVISGYRGLYQQLNEDFPDAPLGPLAPYDQAPTGQFALAQQLNSYEWTQEVKWNGHIGDDISYTAGGYYLYEVNKDNFGAAGNIAGLFGGALGPTYIVPFGDEFTRNDTDSKALYAQAEWRATSALTLTAGVRYTVENKSVLNLPTVPGTGFTNADLRANGYRTELATDQLTPHFAAQYQLDPNLMVFASATRGFQGGGWNGLAFSAPTFNDFGPETLWSYEVGERFETDDHRLRLNTTLFYEDVKHYQLLADVPGTTDFVTNNAAGIIGYGLETELTWRPIDPLTLNANLGLLSSHYVDPSAGVAKQQQLCRASPGPQNLNCGGGIVTFSGDLAPPADAPPATVAASAIYLYQGEGYTLQPSIGVQWVARHNVSTQGVIGGVQVGYTLLDMGLTFKMDGQPWSLTAECRNCGMADYGTTYVFGYKYLNVPGSWDVRFNYRF